MARMTRSLPCALTPAELDERRDRIVALMAQEDELQAQIKEVGSELRGQVKEVKGAIKLVAKELRERATKRDVECVEIKNDTTFTVEWCRKDTNEVVETRKMTEDEIARAKQGKLPLDKPKLVPPATADGGGPTAPPDLASEGKAEAKAEAKKPGKPAA